ncbi:hypothetical protein J4450_06875 [Candidatus Micrarchaeota archaeon]|nr:hypothetical protein [Candidatus Micrarchaeota archaeon]
MIKLYEDYLEVSDSELITKLIGLGAGIEEGGKAKLPLLEAAYFADKGVIKFDKDKILENARKGDALADDKYKIIKFLRDRGYITRVSMDTTEYFRVHQKGIRVGEDRTQYVLKVVPRDWQTNMKDIKQAIGFAGKLRKELVIAYIEKEDIHFIKISRTNFE